MKKKLYAIINHNYDCIENVWIVRGPEGLDVKKANREYGKAYSRAYCTSKGRPDAFNVMYPDGFVSYLEMWHECKAVAHELVIL